MIGELLFDQNATPASIKLAQVQFLDENYKIDEVVNISSEEQKTETNLTEKPETREICNGRIC